MITQCSQLVKMTSEGQPWKCVDERIPARYQGECTMSHLRPRMIGGYILKRVNDLDHNVSLRLGGVGNAAHPQREFSSIDIELIEKENND